MHVRSTATSSSARSASAHTVQTCAQSKHASMHATSALFATPCAPGWVERISLVCIGGLRGRRALRLDVPRSRSSASSRLSGGLPDGRFDAFRSRPLPSSRLPSRQQTRGTTMPTQVVRPLLLGAAVLAAAAHAGASKVHRLTATPDTVQWGWLDPKEPPKLTIESGEIVSIETLMHSKDQIQKGTSMEKIIELRKANPGGGPHSLTGPNFNLPGKEFPTIGALAASFPEGHVQYFDIDPKKPTVVFKPGIEIPLRPFPGTLAVGIDPDDPSPRKGGVKDPMAPVSTLRPWKNGSNMDINELTAGSTIFIPVFLEGGLIWTGDSHCAQGNGEVNLTALECSYESIEIQPIVRKDMKLTWPRIETKTHWITVGFDEDLGKAMTNAVAEVVDVRKGVHCMIPKSLWTGKQVSSR